MKEFVARAGCGRSLCMRPRGGPPCHAARRGAGPIMNARPRADARQQQLLRLVLEIHKITLDPAKRTKTGSMPNLYVEEIRICAGAS